ncbi:MAG: RHS repeat-associated core domain-containing protein [Phycisphaeraceae bacterium]|nr:RHS repeat-associated core domain-containing protein [Phycisphaeraceae bacterium]
MDDGKCLIDEQAAYPIVYYTGNVYETLTDASISTGANLSWAHTRTYNSLLTSAAGGNPFGFNGIRWEAGMLREFIQKDGDNLVLITGAASSIRFNWNAATSTYNSPPGSFYTAVENTTDKQYEVTDTSSGVISTYHSHDASIPSGKRGLLKAMYDTSGTPSSLTTTYTTSETYRITSITTDGPSVSLTYDANGVNEGRITSIFVYDGAPGSSVCLRKVYYTYYKSGQGYSTDVGSDGDLIMVKILERAGGDNLSQNGDDYFSARRTVHYRYYKSGDSNGVAHQIKSVFDSENIQNMIGVVSGVSDEDDVLLKSDADTSTYAARSFTYYTSNEDTSSVTIWGGTRNLHNEFGGTDLNEYYDSTKGGRVKSETVSTGCSSCGGSAESLTSTYHYMTGPGAGTTYNDVKLLVVIDTQDGSGNPLYRKVIGFSDKSNGLRQAFITDPYGSPKYWLSSSIIGTSGGATGKVIESRMASAHMLVDTANELKEFFNPTGTTSSQSNDTRTVSSSSGAIYVYEFNDDGYQIAKKVRNGSSGTAYYVTATDYGDGSTNEPTSQVVATYVYPTATTVKADSVKTEYEYTFWDGAETLINTRTVTQPVISTAQNGSGVASVSKEYYDQAGRLRWLKNAQGTVTYYSYDPEYGRRTYQVDDIDTLGDLPSEVTDGHYSTGSEAFGIYWEEWDDDVPTGFESSGGSHLELVTKTGYDVKGREICKIEADGKKTYTIHWPNKTAVFRACDGTGVPLLPIEITKTDDQGHMLEQYTLDATNATVSDSVPTGVTNETSNNYLSWTKNHYSTSGYLAWTDRYHTIPSNGTAGSLGDNFYRTLYRYDAKGRKTHTIEVVSGTSYSNGVEQVTKIVYDTKDRIIEVWQGVSPAGSGANDMGAEYTNDPAMRKVSAVFYDEATPGSGTPGVGDGYVTSQIVYYDAATESNHVKTRFYRDFLGHQRGVASATAPYAVTDVDFAGRLIAQAHFSQEPTWSTVLADEDYAQNASDANRLSLSTASYDKAGRVYRAATYAVASNGTIGNAVLTDHYFDAMGREVAQTTSGKGATEVAYDAAGRQVEQRLVTELNSTKFDGSGVFQYRSPLPEATSGGDDGVIQIQRSVYNAGGELEESITIEATHDDASAGVDLTAHDDFIRSAVYYWYDAAGRRTAAANYGTCDSNNHWAYAPLTSRPGSAPSSSTSVLVTTQAYNASGRVETTTDPEGKVTRYTYDALGRKVKVEEADGTADECWTLTQYDGVGNVVKLIADVGKDDTFANGAWTTDGDSQVTTYSFEDAYSAKLATKVQYPDSASSTWDVVTMAYALDGKPITKTLPKASSGDTAAAFTYDYDSLRRPTKQRLTTDGSPAVATTVRSIVTAYDTSGRVASVSSYSQSNPTVGTDTPVNEVTYEYDDSGLLVKEYQEHDGAKDGSTLYVGYEYDTAAASGVFTKGLRLKAVRYPNGKRVHYAYGSSGSVADKLSRASAIQDDDPGSPGTPGTTLATYALTGGGRLVVEDFEVPDVKLDYFQGTPGSYAGLDRFGRVTDQRWVKYTSGTVDLDRIQHGYDRAGNRTYRQNTVATAASKKLDQLYTYDNLHRLTSFDRGTLNGNKDAITGTPENEQDWTLDPLGNWGTWVLKTSGSTTLSQTRTPNLANEITSISQGGGQPAWGTPTYDARGNMTVASIPNNETVKYKLSYDAWNRLTKVENEAGTQTIAEYVYDGQNRRVVRKVYAGGSLDKTLDDYFNQQWQLLEVRKNSDSDPLERYIWSKRYIDAPVLTFRDTNVDGTVDQTLYYLTDANMNVTALVDASGAAVERYDYDPYGKAQLYDGSWATRSSSSYDNPIRFGGYRYDIETGLTHVRNRIYHTTYGMWLQRDPKEYADGMSLYRYVSSNPLNLTDYTGLGFTTYAECLQLYPGNNPIHEHGRCVCSCCVDVIGGTFDFYWYGVDCAAPITVGNVIAHGACVTCCATTILGLG